MNKFVIPAGSLTYRENVPWSHTFPVGGAVWTSSIALARPVDPRRAVCQIVGELGARSDPPTTIYLKAEISSDGTTVDITAFGSSADTSTITYSGVIEVLEFAQRPKRIQKVATKGGSVALTYPVNFLRAWRFNACAYDTPAVRNASCYLIDGTTINTDHSYSSAYCCVYVVEF